MRMNDRVEFVENEGKPSVRETSKGYLVADARVSRTGIQVYGGREVGRSDMATVRIYRPEEEVFHEDSMHSATFKAVTDDHPSEGLNATNWTRLSRGFTEGRVARDGGFLRVPLMITDADQVAKWKAGKKELSVGYDCKLDWTAGTTAEGQAYDAIQRDIRFDHVAIVDRGRAGAECRVGDENSLDPGEPKMRKMMVDGIGLVEVGDDGSAEAAIGALQKKITDGAAASATALTAAVSAKDGEIAALKATHTTELAAKDTEIAALKAAAPSTADLDARVAARAQLVSDAKRIGGAALVVDAKTDDEIRLAAVTAKLGADKVKDRDAAFITTAFDTLALSLPAQSSGGTGDTLRDGLNGNRGLGDQDRRTGDAAMTYEQRAMERQKRRSGMAAK